MIAKLFMNLIFHLKNVSLFVIPLSEIIDKFERRLALVWFFSEGGFGKDDLRGGEVILEVVFMVNTCPLSGCKLEIKCRKTCSTIRTHSCFVYRFLSDKIKQFNLLNPSFF